MRNLIIIFLLLFTISCKSNKRFIDRDKLDSTYSVKNDIEIKGIISKFNDFNLSTNELEFTKYEPIYYKKNGKDTVELKPVTYKKVNTNEIKKEKISIDTTSKDKSIEDISIKSDNTLKDTEIEGYDILKSLIGGIATIITGPFRYFIWIILALLIIPVFRLIKRLLFTSKEENKK